MRIGRRDKFDHIATVVAGDHEGGCSIAIEGGMRNERLEEAKTSVASVSGRA
jgi:hypothetical protein